MCAYVLLPMYYDKYFKGNGDLYYKVHLLGLLDIAQYSMPNTWCYIVK